MVYKMATEKQINANRLNAQKSTGPRTPAGKAISSRNALKTGQFAKSEMALAMADYSTLAADYAAEFDPKTPEARFYVRMIVQSIWQTRQLWRIETALWNNHIHEAERLGENSSLGAVFQKAYKELDRVGRAIEASDNVFYAALKKLTALRTRERKSTAARRPASTETRPANPGLQLVA